MLTPTINPQHTSNHPSSSVPLQQQSPKQPTRKDFWTKDDDRNVLYLIFNLKLLVSVLNLYIPLPSKNTQEPLVKAFWALKKLAPLLKYIFQTVYYNILHTSHAFIILYTPLYSGSLFVSTSYSISSKSLLKLAWEFYRVFLLLLPPYLVLLFLSPVSFYFPLIVLFTNSTIFLKIQKIPMDCGGESWFKKSVCRKRQYESYATHLTCNQPQLNPQHHAIPVHAAL